MTLRNLIIVLPLLTLLGACGSEPCTSTPGAPEARFVVEIAPNQAPVKVGEAAERVFNCAASVEPLFGDVDPADDPAGLSRIYLIVAGSADPARNPWDAAYALQEEGGFVASEPDFRDALADVAERASAGKGCTEEGVPAPADKAWSLKAVRAPEAWALPPRPGGSALGEGVRICHLDTGWAEHVDFDQDRIDLSRAWNVLDNNSDAEDRLDYRGHRGHGTATGSVIMSGGGVDAGGTSPPGVVTGVAPGATLVPIRAMKNVVHFLDTDVAKAVRRATTAECDIVSMSLGGRAFFGLERAIDDAVSRNVVVAAAAGNCVGSVVAPALYDNTIAVAATNAEAKPWAGSSHGSTVTVSAPGEDVYRALRKDPGDATDTVEPSDGTSYATAMIAGAAALWIAHRGDDMPGNRSRQTLFTEALRASSHQPDSWDASEMGAGILNLEALMQFGPAAVAPATQVVESKGERQVTLLALQLDLPRDEVRASLVRLIGEQDFERAMAKLGPELLYIAATQPEAFRASLAALDTAPEGMARSTATRTIAPFASDALAARFGTEVAPENRTGL